MAVKRVYCLCAQLTLSLHTHYMADAGAVRQVLTSITTQIIKQVSVNEAARNCAKR